MRRWVVVVALAVGCHGVTPPAQPTPEPPDLIDGETYAARISGLRATLARNGVDIDTQPEIETCAVGHDHERLRGRCVRCEVATRENTGGVNPTLIDAIAFAFGAYPPSLIAASGLKHVSLCRTIRMDDGEPAPAGVAIAAQHRMLISLEYFVAGAAQYQDFGIGQVVHHEVFHLFDHATSGPAVDDDHEWVAHNPRGFGYRDPAVAGVTRPPGFVNHYATTNAREDRASVFEYLLGQPTRLCEIANVDRVVAAKTKLVWKRVAKIVGDKLLRQHAPCVASVGKRRRGKPAVPSIFGRDRWSTDGGRPPRGIAGAP